MAFNGGMMYEKPVPRRREALWRSHYSFFY